jgi:Fe-S cluster assembly protein SufB
MTTPTPQTDLRDALDTADSFAYAQQITGLNEDTVRAISAAQDEPQWMLEHRLASLRKFYELSMPTWWPSLDQLNLDEIVYFAQPEQSQVQNDREQVDPAIKDKFARLGIPEAEQRYLAGAGGQMDSEVVYHKIKAKRAEKGVIFEDMAEAVKHHEELVRKYFMKLIPAHDHKFMALHGAVWSGGTFIYIPKGVIVDEPLQAYFRMNSVSGGQFEHTLIIVDDDAAGDYIEWCSAPKFNKKSIHAGGVEVYVGKRSRMRYSSVENRSINTYNLNTKRATVAEDGFMEWVNGNLWSGVTMLYPCSILVGDRSRSDQLGIAVAGKDQNQDTGSKVIHIGKDTSSTIISKSISKDWGIATYRGIVDIKASATGAVNCTECDALLMDDISVSTTIPYIHVNNGESTVAHEASAGKVDDMMMFYLMSRGLEEAQAMAMIVNGFISPVVKKLPLEYAGELNRLIEMEMEWSVG